MISHVHERTRVANGRSEIEIEIVFACIVIGTVTATARSSRLPPCYPPQCLPVQGHRRATRRRRRPSMLTRMTPSTPPTTGAITIMSLTLLIIPGATTETLIPATPQAMIMITMTIVSLPFLSPQGLQVLLSHVSFFVRLPQPSKTPTPILMFMNSVQSLRQRTWDLQAVAWATLTPQPSWTTDRPAHGKLILLGPESVASRYPRRR